MTEFSPRDLIRRVQAVPGAGWTLVGAGAVLLLALFFLLTRPSPGHVPVVEMQDPRVAAMAARLDAAEARLLRAEAPRPDTTAARLDATEAAISARVTAADAALAARLDAAQEALAARLTAAEAGLAPLAALTTADARQSQALEALTARIATGEAAMAVSTTRQTQLVEALTNRLAAADTPIAALTASAARQAQALEALTARLAAAEAALTAATASHAQAQEALTTRTDRLAERLDAAAARATQAETDQNRRFETLLAEAQATGERRSAALDQAMRQALAALDASAAQRFASVEARTRALAAQEALRGALDGGRPLGPILAGMPTQVPALARFATAPAPTEAQLRASFEDAARAARAAGNAAPRGSIAESALNRLGGMVTLRRGDEVVWGDPGESELERARRALAASDLAGAIDRLARLPPAAREAMAPWIGDVQALLDARTALLALSAG